MCAWFTELRHPGHAPSAVPGGASTTVSSTYGRWDRSRTRMARSWVNMRRVPSGEQARSVPPSGDTSSEEPPSGDPVDTVTASVRDPSAVGRLRRMHGHAVLADDARLVGR